MTKRHELRRTPVCLPCVPWNSASCPETSSRGVRSRTQSPLSRHPEVRPTRHFISSRSPTRPECHLISSILIELVGERRLSATSPQAGALTPLPYMRLAAYLLCLSHYCMPVLSTAVR